MKFDNINTKYIATCQVWKRHDDNRNIIIKAIILFFINLYIFNQNSIINDYDAILNKIIKSIK